MKLYGDEDDSTLTDEETDTVFTTDLADPTITEEDLRWAYPDLHIERNDTDGDEDEEII